MTPNFSLKGIEGFSIVHKNHIGCFNDQSSDHDLYYKQPFDTSSLTIEACTGKCASLYYRYSLS